MSRPRPHRIALAALRPRKRALADGTAGANVALVLTPAVEALFEAAPDAMLLTAAGADRVIAANAAAGAFFGAAPERLKGRSIGSLVEWRTNGFGPGDGRRACMAFRAGGGVLAEAAVAPLDLEGVPVDLYSFREVPAGAAEAEELRRRLEVRERETRALLDAARNLTSNLSLEPLVGSLLEHLHSVIDYAGSSLLVFEGPGRLRILEARRFEGGAGLRSDEASGLILAIDPADPIWRTLYGGEGIVVGDIQDDTPTARSLRREMRAIPLLRGLGIRAWMATPLVVSGTAAGLLTISRREPNSFTPGDVELARAFAVQASAALANAGLFEQLRQQALQNEMLAQVAAEFTLGGDICETLNRVCAHIARATGAEAADIVIPAQAGTDRFQSWAYGGYGHAEGFLEVAEQLVAAGAPTPITTVLETMEIMSSAGARDLILSLPEWEPLRPYLARAEWDQMVVVPMVYRGRPIGVIEAYFRPDTALAAGTTAFLKAIADQAAVGVENIRLFGDTQRSAREYATLARIALDLTLDRPMDDTLRSICEGAVRGSGAVGATISLLIEDTDQLLLEGGWGLSDEYLAVARRFPVTRMPGRRQLLTEGKPLAVGSLVATAERTPDFAPLAPYLREAGIDSGAFLPLWSRGRAIGTLALLFATSEAPSPEDLRFYTAVANQVTVAIDNKRLYERMEQSARESAALAAIAANITLGQPVRSTLDIVATSVVSATSAISCTVSIIDPVSGVMWMAGGAGVPEGFVEIARYVSDRPGSWRNLALERGEPLIQHEVKATLLANPDFRPIHEAIAAEAWDTVVSFPVSYGGRHVGVLQVGYEGDTEPAPDEWRLLGAIADQLAVAIENAGLYLRSERRARENAALAEIARHVVVDQPMRATLEALARNVVAATAASGAAVFLVDMAADRIVLAAGHGIAGTLLQKIEEALPASAGFTREAFGDGRQIFVPDARTKMLANPVFSPIHDVLHGEAWEHVQVVPIFYRGEALGALYLTYVAASEASADEQHLLDAIANQAAIAIENVRLFQRTEADALENARLSDERQRRVAELEALMSIAESLTLLQPFETTLKTLVERVVQSTDAEACSVLLYDDTQALVQVATEGLPAEFVQGMREVYATPRRRERVRRFLGNQGERVLFTSRAELLGAEDLAPLHGPAAAASWDKFVIVGLHFQGRPLGTLAAYYPAGFEPGEREANLLVAIGDQVAVALENTRLFAESSQRVAELEALQSIAASLTHVQTLEATFDTLVHNVVTATRAMACAVSLFDDEGRTIFMAQHGLPEEYGPAIVDVYKQPRAARVAAAFATALDASPLISTRSALLRSRTFAPAHEVIERAGYETYMTTLIVYQGKGIGALMTYYAPGSDPDERDIALMRAVADQAAVAIENARLFADAEKRAHEQEVLATIASAITNDRPLGDLLERLARNVVEQAGVAGATVLLFGATPGRVEVGSFGLPKGYVAEMLESRRRYPEVWEQVDRSTETSILEGAREFIRNNATHEPLRAYADSFPFDCIVRVPLVYQQVARGILMLYLEQSTAPEAGPLAFYEAIAERVTLAVENARLFAESERRAREQAALATIGAALTYDRPLQDVLDGLARALSEHTPACAASVLVFGDEAKPLAAGSFGLPDGYLQLTIDSREAHPEVWSSLDRATDVTILEHARDYLRERAAYEPIRAYADAVPWDSVVRVPFLYRERTRGMLNFYLPGSTGPAGEDLAFFRAIADRASVAIESARLFADVERRAREQAALATISSALTYDRPLGEVLSVLAATIVAVSDAIGVAIVVYEDRSRPFASGVAGLPEGYLSAIAEAQRADPAFWQAMESITEPSVIDNAQERIARDPEWATLRRFLPLNWNSVVRLPFVHRERTHGMLNLFLEASSAPPRRDMEFYSAIADRASVAVDNASLFAEVQSRTHELTALYRADEELHRSLELDDVLKALMDVVVENLQVDGAAVQLWPEDEPEPRLLTAGKADPVSARRVVESIAAGGREEFVRTARERHERAIAIGETEGNPLVVAEQTTGVGIRSLLEAGVMVGDEVFGKLTAYHFRRRRFSDEERRVFVSLSRRAALAIENARLFGQARERTQQLAAMYRADEELHRSLQLDEVMKAFLSTIIDTFEADNGTVILWPPDQARPRMLFAAPVADEIAERVVASLARQGREEYVRALAEGDVHAVEDTEALVGPVRERTFEIGVRSLIEAPLLLDGEFVGHVIAVYGQPRRFDRDEQRLLSALTRRAEVAIENARLYGEAQERTRQLEALYRADEELHRSLQLDDVLNGLISTVRDTFAPDSVVAMVWEEGDARPRFIAGSEEGPDSAETIVANLARAGRDAYIRPRTGVRPIEDSAELPPEVRARTYDVGVRALLEAPLRAEGKTIGHIGIRYRSPRRFSAEEQRLLGSLARRAEVAIDNARLYGRAQTLAAVEERQRLARELHDSVSQALYGIALGARTARTLLDRDPAQATEPVDYVLSLAEAGLAEMRALIFELRPESLEQEGLVAAIDKQVASTRARYGVAVDASLCPEPDVPLAVKEAFYRVAQEALHNVVKHARATHVDLTLDCDSTRMTLDLRDNGQGFDPDGDFPGHLGLRSMRERVTRIGGGFLIESAPGMGTHLRAEVPL